jgi:hypothetical protein
MEQLHDISDMLIYVLDFWVKVARSYSDCNAMSIHPWCTTTSLSVFAMGEALSAIQNDAQLDVEASLLLYVAQWSSPRLQ